MSIEKISIDQVKIGMYVDKLDVSWFRHPFLGNSFLLSNEKDLTKLKKSKATYAYVDTEKGFYFLSETPQSNMRENQTIINKYKGIS